MTHSLGLVVLHVLQEGDHKAGMGIEQRWQKQGDLNSCKEAHTSAYRCIQVQNGIPAGAGSVIRRAVLDLSERFWVI